MMGATDVTLPSSCQEAAGAAPTIGKELRASVGGVQLVSGGVQMNPYMDVNAPGSVWMVR